MNGPIRFQFSVEKAIQAVGFLMAEHGTARVKFLRILKLLFLADRENIRRIGKPITGDTLTVMKNGPLPKTIYDFMKTNKPHPPAWDDVFSVVGNDLRVRRPIKTDLLSANEADLLRRLVRENKGKTRWKIADDLHPLPEVNERWDEAKRFNTSIDIPFEEILQAVGRENDLAAIAEAADAAQTLKLIAG